MKKIRNLFILVLLPLLSISQIDMVKNFSNGLIINNPKLTIETGTDTDATITVNGTTSDGQLKYMEDEDRWDFAETIKISGNIIYQPTDLYWAFKDSAVVISGGTNVQITNATDSLYRKLIDLGGATYLDGDTISVTKAAILDIFIGLWGSGTNAVDWSLQVAQKRAGATTYSNSEILFTTTGGTNKDGGFSMFRRDAEIGDKYWFVLTRNGGSGDFTVASSTMKVQEFYVKP